MSLAGAVEDQLLLEGEEMGGMLTRGSRTLEDIGFSSDHGTLAEDGFYDATCCDGLNHSESSDGGNESGGELHVCGWWI
jgi:hypothetical protein